MDGDLVQKKPLRSDVQVRRNRTVLVHRYHWRLDHFKRDCWNKSINTNVLPALMCHKHCQMAKN